MFPSLISSQSHVAFFSRFTQRLEGGPEYYSLVEGQLVPKWESEDYVLIFEVCACATGAPGG